MCRLESDVSIQLPKNKEELRMRKSSAMAVVVLLFVAALSSAAFAQKATVPRVVTVKTDDPAAYAQEIENAGRS